MQREQAMLATRLQREREEREEDRVAVRLLIDALNKNGIEAEGEMAEAEREICMSPEDMTAETEGTPGSKHDSPMERAETSSSVGITSSTTESILPKTESTATPSSSTLTAPESSGHDLDKQSPGGTPAHISLSTTLPSSAPNIPALLTTLEHRFSTPSNRDSAV
ncbi:hypothetical protein V491_01520, partial [Pseudogymnoascus sp. VKM F-3775]